MPTAKKPRVLILGAGFGGLTAARAFGDSADVTLIDRHNFQTFLPLLYQVATAGLAADHVAHQFVAHCVTAACNFEWVLRSPLTIRINL